GPVRADLEWQGSTGRALSTLTTVMAVNGVATMNLSLTSAVRNAILVFSASNGPGFLSSAFDVTPFTPNTLVFDQQPVNAVVGQPLTPPVVVQVLDRYGNLVNGYSSAVTVALESSPGSTILSETTVTASQGIASFNDLSFNK